ncbi:MAG: hypothetical protein ACLUOI_11930 [Eisenbergiella sp.]
MKNWQSAEQWLVFVVFVGIRQHCSERHRRLYGIGGKPLLLQRRIRSSTLHWFCRSNSRLHGQYYLTGTDVLLSGVSTTAYQLVIPDGVVEPTCNYYL